MPQRLKKNPKGEFDSLYNPSKPKKVPQWVVDEARIRVAIFLARWTSWKGITNEELKTVAMSDTYKAGADELLKEIIESLNLVVG